MKTILLIEDNKEIRENTAEILEMSDYNVVAAKDGKEGVALAVEHKPDLIICDIMMPVLDGYGVINILHNNVETRNIPFIFLSAKSERIEVRKGMELGADDYITKPFNGTELLNAVQSRLHKAELLQKDFLSGLEGLDNLVHVSGGMDVFNRLSENRSSQHFNKKQIVYSENRHPLHLYFVKKGSVKAYRTNEDGKQLTTALYSEGDFLGYMALLEKTAYKETAEALETTELAVIPKEEFERLMNSSREVMQKFIQLLANNISDNEDKLLGMAYNSLRKKVAETLIAIMKKYKKTNTGPFSIDMSRENLANIAGTAKESLIRTLSDFKDEKLIDIREGSILILNEKKLEHLVN